MQYEHKLIESKWQKAWQQARLYRAEEDSSKEKYYVLDMFPYPSGDGLHMGHPKGYTATDVIARKRMMEGFNVLHPMGFDAFGLPAENYALKNKIHPRVAMEKNVALFRQQLERFGFTYDWERTVDTTDPDFYKWTQWAFIKMFEKGLAYESHEPINWCPSCKTGLANEDVEDGHCERCGTAVEKKPMRQWVLRITEYAERLLADLDALDWPEAIKESQRNWIGKSEGAELTFEIAGRNEKIRVFTTRPDTLFGATYLVIAPEHPMLDSLKEVCLNQAAVSRYIEVAGKKTEIERTAEGKEKTGVELEGVRATHPLTGEALPVWIADYVLPDYGTGAIMAVPAHDARDYSFARKYDLPIKDTVIPAVVDSKNPPREGVKTVTRRTVHALVRNPKDNTFLLLRWKEYPWRNFIVGEVEEDEDIVDAARREVIEETGYRDLEFKKVLGGPIEARYYAAHKNENRLAYTSGIYFELRSEEKTEVEPEEKDKYDLEWVALDDMTAENMVCAELDIWKERLADDAPYAGEGVLFEAGEFSGMKSVEAKQKITAAAGGQSTIRYKLRDWVFSRQRYWGEPIPIIHCETCGPVTVPEKDLPVVLPEVESYEPSGTGESPLAAISEWINTVCPKCGGAGKRETNTMPQWAGSSWYYLRFMDPHNNEKLVDAAKEKYWSPVDLYIGGAEHATRHLIYARFWHKFLFDGGVVSTVEPFKRYTSLGLILAEDGRKMSKRWGNVISPNEIIDRYGADALRLYIMFIGPFAQAAAFKEEGVAGAHSFLKRVWKLREKVGDEPEAPQVKSLLHKTIKKVGDDIEALRFNTAVSSLMILTNALGDAPSISSDSFTILIKLLAPFCPHIAEELWQESGSKGAVGLAAWPVCDESLLVEETAVIAVQINGKLRDTFEVEAAATEAEIKAAALERPNISKWTEGKAIKKIIVVKGKVVNIVL